MDLSRTDGGLIVPTGAHESAVQAALRDHDSDLRLVPQDSDHYGRRVYKVYRYAGSDRPAEFLLFWGDEHGNAFPLSMAIVDAVQRLDKNLRGFDPRDADVHNAALRMARERESRDWGDELAREFEGKLEGKKSSPLHRSQSLRRARDKVRARTPKELRP